MSLIIADRVKETTITTGTGSLTLAGAEAGFQAFDTVMNTADTCYYRISQQVAGQWETGLGTFTAPSTLARTTPDDGSAATPVNFTAGTKDVVITFPGDPASARLSIGAAPLDSPVFTGSIGIGTAAPADRAVDVMAVNTGDAQQVVAVFHQSAAGNLGAAAIGIGAYGAPATNLLLISQNSGAGGM